MVCKNPGPRPEETQEGRLGRIERVRNGRSEEEKRTLKEDGYNVPIILLSKLKYATVLPSFLKCVGIYFFFFFLSTEEEVFFLFYAEESIWFISF